MQILKSCLFPEQIHALGVKGILTEIKKIGVNYGLTVVHLKFRLLIKELELLTKQLEQVEETMALSLVKTGYKEMILSILGGCIRWPWSWLQVTMK